MFGVTRIHWECLFLESIKGLQGDRDNVTGTAQIASSLIRKNRFINECPKTLSNCHLYNPVSPSFPHLQNLQSIPSLLDMLQVASHPTSFTHAPRHPRSIPTSSTVQLPRTLARPPFAEVSREAIIAVAPELANVPPEYIRRGLRPQTHQYVILHIIHHSIKFINLVFLECSQALLHYLCQLLC